MSTKSIYQNTPFGIATGFPWLTKADTKYNEQGVFKCNLTLGGPEAQALKAKVDTACAAALERYFEEKKLDAKTRKGWKVYRPYTEDTDDAGAPTGYIEFRFKQNAVLKLKDGTTKKVKIAVMDATNKKEVTRPVFGGSELRIQFTMRDIVMTSAREVGIQLAFGRVQVKKLAESGTGGANGFDAVEGYTEDDSTDGEGGSPSSSKGDNQQDSTDGDF